MASLPDLGVEAAGVNVLHHHLVVAVALLAGVGHLHAHLPPHALVHPAYTTRPQAFAEMQLCADEFGAVSVTRTTTGTGGGEAIFPGGGIVDWGYGINTYNRVIGVLVVEQGPIPRGFNACVTSFFGPGYA